MQDCMHFSSRYSIVKTSSAMATASARQLSYYQQGAAARHLMSAPHIRSPEELCRHFEVDDAVGLSEEAVVINRSRFGFNELEQPPATSLLTLLLEQFQDLLARILLLAALVSFVLALVSGDEDGLTAFVEPGVILLILVANAAVSVWQETNAEKSLEALKRLQPELARTLRGGELCTVPARELVPGDIVHVRVGDKVPADMRILKLETASLRTEQSQLTGETQSVRKEIGTLPATMENCEIQAMTNVLFNGTTIANGGAKAIVTHTGMLTEIGKIQTAVQQAGEDEEQTPLQQKLEEFGSMLTRVIGVICLLVWLINFGNFSEPSHGGFLRGCIYYFKTAVALAVAAIPEGLTAVITTCLALGTRKMAQKNAIVRRLPSVETLGCTTVICSDKTGTLTTNQMSCVRFAVPASPESLDAYLVEGHTYNRVGRIRKVVDHPTDSRQQAHFSHIPNNNVVLQVFAKCAALCNQARLQFVMDQEKQNRAVFERTQSSLPQEDCAKLLRRKSSYLQVDPNSVVCHGEPTEGALKVLVEKLGCPDEAYNSANLQHPRGFDGPEAFCSYWTRNIERLAVLELTRDRKSMSVLCREEGRAGTVLYVKGAPESILDRCAHVLSPDGSISPLTSRARSTIMNEVDNMAREALRPLALAVRFDTGALRDYDGSSHPHHSQLAEPENFVAIETQLVFCGVVGIVDPPRPEVAGAIKRCRAAGIKVIMITGDNKKTAEAVAVKVGIVKTEDLGRVSYTGKEFELLSERDKIRVLSNPHGAVFSRTEPKHKQLIVRILRELGEITAMTGDGVNDAPALKQADIGIAMGIAGTEVAKGAADMVLADDNFNTIVAAVEQGRGIYMNMKAFIRYLISSNIGEVASIFITAALGIPEGLAPVQLLWVNLVTDGFPATALGFNPPDIDVMQRAPRRRDDPLISGWVFLRYLLIGLYVGFATVGIFVWWYVYGVDPRDGHTLISFAELSNWSKCHSWGSFSANPVYGMDPNDPCTYFYQGKVKASTLSLTVLVIIEMFNALNALSEEGSLLQVPPWANPWLLLAIGGSVLVHCCILYIPWASAIFGVVPLTWYDWYWVIVWSVPVLLIDECLKAYARLQTHKATGRLAKLTPNPTVSWNPLSKIVRKKE